MENYKGIFDVWVKDSVVILTEYSEKDIDKLKNDGCSAWGTSVRVLYGTISITDGVLSYSGESFKTEALYKSSDSWGLNKESLTGDDAWVDKMKNKYWIGDDRFKKVTIKKWFRPNEETNELLVHSYLRKESDLINGVSSNFRLNLLAGKNVKKVIL